MTPATVISDEDVTDADVLALAELAEKAMLSGFISFKDSRFAAPLVAVGGVKLPGAVTLLTEVNASVFTLLFTAFATLNVPALPPCAGGVANTEEIPCDPVRLPTSCAATCLAASTIFAASAVVVAVIGTFKLAPLAAST